MNIYKSTYFKIEELVHPQIISKIGETNSWMRLSLECLKDIDLIRHLWYAEHGSGVYCNRINAGIDSRGLRPPNDPDGSFYSVHKMGKAFDLEPVNGDHEKFYSFVKDLMNKGAFLALNTLEDRSFTPTWCHVAEMNHGLACYIIKP